MKRAFRLRLTKRASAVVLLLTFATGVLVAVSPILSEVVNRDLPPISPAVSLGLSGIPPEGHAGDVFRIVAAIHNSANRPLPAVVRMDVRNLNTSIAPEDVTVYVTCGAEEAASSRTLRYYLGSHGPLLAPNGSSFDTGTTVATVESALGLAGHWEVVLHEVRHRDPAGYASFIAPGDRAAAGPRSSSSIALKALSYFGMVSSPTPVSGDPADWTLVVPFTDVWAPTDGNAAGFLVEIAPTVRGAFTFKLWAELPDAEGVPAHTGWKCGAL